MGRINYFSEYKENINEGWKNWVITILAILGSYSTFGGNKVNKEKGNIPAESVKDSISKISQKFHEFKIDDYEGHFNGGYLEYYSNKFIDKNVKNGKTFFKLMLVDKDTTINTPHLKISADDKNWLVVTPE